MATRLRTLKIDENDAQKSKKVTQIQKIGTGAPAQTKRAALGELGNRAVAKPIDGQKENVNYLKYQETFKNVKPRVDTHRKKPETVVSATNKVVVRTLKPATTTTAVLASTKPLNEPKVVKPRAVAKPVKVDKPQVQPVLKAQQLVPVRREESNVSRKSLSKLKAVLCKEKQATTKSARPIVSVKPFEIECKIEAHSSSLFDEVDNIDASDGKNPLLVAEYANDIYAYLFSMEESLCIRKTHLDKQAEVTPKMRAVLYDWINEVHYQFRLLPETYHLTIGIIDRYLQAVPTTVRQQLQLVGLGALFLASKYEELYPPEIGDFVYIADDTYTKHQILAIEQKIFKSIDFNLGRPSSIHFLRRFSKAASTVDETHMLAKYLIELVSIEYSLAHYKPSEVAAASLFLSLKLFNKRGSLTDSQIWTNTLQFYTTHTVEHLRPLVKKIAQLVKSAPTSQLKAVYNKYQSSKFDKISTKSELNGPLLEKICSEDEQ